MSDVASLVLLPGLDSVGVTRLNVWMRTALIAGPRFTQLPTELPGPGKTLEAEVWAATVYGGEWRAVVARLPDCGWIDPTEVFLWVKPQGEFPRVYRADCGQPETWMIQPENRRPRTPSEALA